MCRSFNNLHSVILFHLINPILCNLSRQTMLRTTNLHFSLPLEKTKKETCTWELSLTTAVPISCLKNELCAYNTVSIPDLKCKSTIISQTLTAAGANVRPMHRRNTDVEKRNQNQNLGLKLTVILAAASIRYGTKCQRTYVPELQGKSNTKSTNQYLHRFICTGRSCRSIGKRFRTCLIKANFRGNALRHVVLSINLTKHGIISNLK